MGQHVNSRIGPDEGENFEYSWSNEYLEVHLISDVGRKREHNEDSCLIGMPLKDKLIRDRGFLVAVADGMGGASAGEYASRLALTTLVDIYYKDADSPVPEVVEASIKRANAEVFEKAQTDPQYNGMGTTMSALMLVGDCAYVGQVGDSRVYAQREGAPIYQITRDHSLVAEQVRNGILTEEEAEHHSLKNLITRAIGIRDEVDVDRFAFRFREGDMFVICSDGLSNMVDDHAIQKSLETKTLQGAARLLIGRALDAGGTDNVTAILVRVVGEPPKKQLEEGCEAVDLVPTQTIFNRLKTIFT